MENSNHVELKAAPLVHEVKINARPKPSPLELAKRGIQNLIAQAEHEADKAYQKMERHKAEAMVLRNALHEVEKQEPKS